jgi:hypothetical protein
MTVWLPVFDGEQRQYPKATASPAPTANERPAPPEENTRAPGRAIVLLVRLLGKERVAAALLADERVPPPPWSPANATGAPLPRPGWLARSSASGIRGRRAVVARTSGARARRPPAAGARLARQARRHGPRRRAARERERGVAAHARRGLAWTRARAAAAAGPPRPRSRMGATSSRRASTRASYGDAG